MSTETNDLHVCKCKPSLARVCVCAYVATQTRAIIAPSPVCGSHSLLLRAWSSPSLTEWLPQNPLPRLAALGFDVSVARATDSNLKLHEYGVPLYDHVILFAPKVDRK